ncbi:hypothetical protein ACFPPD_07555 [Cohnella suwonensis]|uniref:Uncharacterized protein n=1 Tax=Cohnella suwonensis TaxID=696072 RepID=A0ABW0LS37_9BACL
MAVEKFFPTGSGGDWRRGARVRPALAARGLGEIRQSSFPAFPPIATTKKRLHPTTNGAPCRPIPDAIRAALPDRRENRMADWMDQIKMPAGILNPVQAFLSCLFFYVG